MMASSKSFTRRSVLIIIITALLLSPLARPLRGLLTDLARPLGKALYAAGFFTSPFRISEPDQAGRLRLAESERAKLAHENRALRRQLNFTLSSDLKTVGADIIGRSGEVLSRDIRLNRGSRDGVRVDAAVIADGYLVGKVTSVSENSSHVQLLSDPDFRLTVLVGTSPNPGLARGSLGGVTVTRLPITDQIKTGDVVISSDLGLEVPTGIPIGTVTNVRVKDSVFYEVDVEVPVYLESLQMVLVVLP